MIKQIFDGIPERVDESYYGRKITAAYLAYGSGYDFCRFYSSDSGGIVHIYNASMVISGNVDKNDIETLVQITMPVNIEMKSKEPLQLSNDYSRTHRTLFHTISGKTDIKFKDVNINGFTEKCFSILAESFENIGGYDGWYVDISHRIRHGIAELYLYDSTTITKAFDINGYVFLSHIATAASERGKGTARRLLYCLAEKFGGEGKNAYLFAQDHRSSFYKSIGFEAVGEDIFYTNQKI